MTLSLAGRCARTGQFGVIVTSSSPAVAARCAYVRAGVGAACSQNITDPRLGDRLLDLMDAGETAERAIAALVRDEPLIAYRQLSAIDREGGVGSFSGERTLGVHGSLAGRDGVAAANLLAHSRVLQAMMVAFEADPERELEECLLAAAKAGIEAGGEAGPVKSAGLAVVGAVPWRTTDLRVDWADDPIAELDALWTIWKPQKADYLSRALDPASSPAYGVPGDPIR
jgi:uncharacterized Ntn-hydrolase superfamily protein